MGEKEILTKYVNETKSMAGFLRRIGKKPFSGNYQTYWNKFAKLEINTAHWDGKAEAAKKLKQFNDSKRKSLSEILVKNSFYNNTSRLKRRLLKAQLLENKCYVSDCPTHSMPGWCGKKIPLHLDHINGDRRDNRLSNLQLLCPICHSLTETYAGKNRGKGNISKCPLCHKKIWKTSMHCKKCANKLKSNVQFEWPDQTVLAEMLRNSNINKVSKILGCSYNGLKKHLKKIGLSQTCTGTISFSGIRSSA